MSPEKELFEKSKVILQLASAQGIIPARFGQKPNWDDDAWMRAVLLALKTIAPEAPDPLAAADIALRKLRAGDAAPVKKTRKANASGDAYQLKISLADAKPAIFRRVIVDSAIKLDFLHLIIQTVLSWSDTHLHVFDSDGVTFGPDPEDDANERTTPLSELLFEEKMEIGYTYDFGDNWQHVIRLEKIMPAETHPQTMICTAGKGRRPPEDCGGIYRFTELLQALAQAQHKYHEEAIDALGEAFDPAEFDLNYINKQLAALKKPRRSGNHGARLGH